MRLIILPLLLAATVLFANDYVKRICGIANAPITLGSL